VLDLDDKSLDPVPHVMTDPFRLGQVLVNLVSNAMRYSGDGPVKRVVINFAMRPEPPTCVFLLSNVSSFDSDNSCQQRYELPASLGVVPR